MEHLPSISNRVRKAFHQLGLTDYEMRAYLALLKRGEMTANEISEAAAIPYSKIYEVLESLERKGWISSEGGRPAKYYPRNLSTALEVNRMRIEKELKKHESVLLAEIPQLVDAIGSREKHDVWILRGEENVLSRLKSLLSSCDMELQIASPWIDRELVELLLPVLALLKAKNGSARIMLSADCNKSLARKLSGYAEVRFRDQLFGGGVIADSGEAIIILGGEKGKPTLAIWSDHVGLARIAKVYFEHLWKDAKPLK